VCIKNVQEQMKTIGLKVCGRNEWHQEKHDVAARRTWRKLHLAVDENHQRKHANYRNEKTKLG